MKRNIINIISALCMICGFTACKDNTSDLSLSGNCMIESIALDGYQGVIDLAARTITVRLPEVYETSAMKVTALSISQGAVCNIQQGQTILIQPLLDLGDFALVVVEVRIPLVAPV